MHVDVTVPSIDTTILSGSGNVVATGAARRLAHAHAPGLGEPPARRAHRAGRDRERVRVGSILVHATRSLHASVSGSGVILYLGTPRIVKTRASRAAAPSSLRSRDRRLAVADPAVVRRHEPVGEHAEALRLEPAPRRVRAGAGSGTCRRESTTVRGSAGLGAGARPRPRRPSRGTRPRSPRAAGRRRGRRGRGRRAARGRRRSATRTARRRRRRRAARARSPPGPRRSPRSRTPSSAATASNSRPMPDESGAFTAGSRRTARPALERHRPAGALEVGRPRRATARGSPPRRRAAAPGRGARRARTRRGRSAAARRPRASRRCRSRCRRRRARAPGPVSPCSARHAAAWAWWCWTPTSSRVLLERPLRRQVLGVEVVRDHRPARRRASRGRARGRSRNAR